MVVDVVVHNLQNITSTDMRKNIYYVVTPRCAAAAVVSAVVLRRPTKEYTRPYSMIHRRLPTAGIEVAPHYHQLLVVPEQNAHIISRALSTGTHIFVCGKFDWVGFLSPLFFLYKINFNPRSYICWGKQWKVFAHVPAPEDT